MARELIGIGYSRSSRDDGDETFSIDSQERYIREYAQKHGITVPDEYMIMDEFTGFTLDRPGFNKIMQLVQAGKVDCLIVHKVNRIARKSHLADWFLQEIVFPANVQLHIVEWGKSVQLNSKNDLLLYNLQANFGQFDAMDIKERTTRGRREKAEQGIWLGQGITVYGYRKEGTRKNTMLYIVDSEAEIVRLIFHLFVNEGIQTTDIVRFLNAQDIPSPSQSRAIYRRKRNWRMNSVSRILRDSRYAGIWYSYRYYENSGKTQLRPQEEWIKHEFPNLAIVDEDTFKAMDEAQGTGRVSRMGGFVRNGRAIIVNNNTKAHILSTGLLSCKVRILEGEYKNQTGWIYSDWIKT